MASFTIDYSSGDRTLSVKPVDNLFEVLHATISNEKLSQLKLNQLIADATPLYEKASLTEIEAVPATSTASSDSASSSTDEEPSGVFATPTKKKSNSNNLAVLASPTSIVDMLDETPVKLYDTKFIDILVTTFFESSTSTSTSTPVVQSSDSEPHQPILLSIEGNIGAGKSTLLRALRESHPEWTFIDEPLDTWTALKNETGNLIECFYGDQDRWAYTFQVLYYSL